MICIGLLSASCTVSSTDGGDASGYQEISLALNPQSPVSRANAVLNGNSTEGTGEFKLNTVTVGIFDASASGTMLTLHPFTYSKGNAEKITTKLTAKYIEVAANLPSTLFPEGTSRDDFKSKTLDLAYTTSADGTSSANKTSANSQQQTALPMYASYVIPSSTLNVITVNKVSVSMKRMVARVMLKTLKTDLIVPTAKFVPTEIFMYRVNDQYTLDGAASASAPLVSGESRGNFSYLSSGSELGFNVPQNGKATFISDTDYPYYFYVFPHNATSPTRLVIKGTYYRAGGTTAIVYYPIVINKSNDSTIAANTTYTLNVTITGEGAATPDADPANITVKMSVADWGTFSGELTFLPLPTDGNISVGGYTTSNQGVSFP